jgi:poly(ADP-ribose) glycohydrolase ARH3
MYGDPAEVRGAAAMREKFAGCLLGGMLGDVIGAPVEAESPGYIRKTFQNPDEILALKTVPELLSGEWEVGRFTDDTQMSLAVAEWLANQEKLDGPSLLEGFCRAYEPWRHYGSGTRLILESFPNARDKWADLATAMFPQGSYGNGAAMRVAPVGLYLHNDLSGLVEVARTSSMVTHSHSLAVQGAALQATAVAAVTRAPLDTVQFLRILGVALARFEELGQDTSVYRQALATISEGISRAATPEQMARRLGNGVKAQEAVPMAIYCFLAHPGSFEKALEAAIFLGGDTDTIASMTGSISGAALGESQIPERWLRRVTEPVFTPARVRKIAFDLCAKGLERNFSARRRSKNAGTPQPPT